MSKNYPIEASQIVMDVLPWPSGHGFRGATAWWDYVLTQDERQRLDQLLGLALLDQDVRERLLEKREKTLFERFGLSQATQRWLESIQADSLPEFAQAILVGPVAQSEAA